MMVQVERRLWTAAEYHRLAEAGDYKMRFVVDREGSISAAAFLEITFQVGDLIR